MSAVAYAPEEIITDQPTRAAKYRWAIVVDSAIGAGLMTNAVACIAATTGALVSGLIARGGPDASGRLHPGLPWAGCTVLTGSADELAPVRERAADSEGMLVVDMPAAAQTHRIYDDYLDELARTVPDELRVCAFSIVGPRNRVDKLTKRLSLLP